MKPDDRARTTPDPNALREAQEIEVYRIELEIQNEELRAARAEVEAGLERYTELFDFAPIGYFVVGGDGAIRQSNLAAARLLGTHRQALVGQPLSHFLADEAVSRWRDLLGRVLLGSSDGLRSESCDVTLAVAGRDPIEAYVTATSLTGATPTALVAVEDVTLRRRAEAELRDEARRKDDFLAVLSHELRNPLAPIRNNLFVLERAEPGGEQAREARAAIARQIDHLSRIVDDLLDVTRIVRGKVRLRRDILALSDVVRLAMDDHRGEFVANGIDFEAHLPVEPLFVDADLTRILQILGNLFMNAAKFTPRGGKVTVALERSGPTAILTVRDTGMGIAPDVKQRLFEPFRQAPQTLDRTRGGLGLGLAMVKGLVELHGGTVEVESQGIARGSTFTIRLPLHDAPAVPKTIAKPRAARRRRILVIEDNVDAADSLRFALELGGHHVLSALDGRSGLALLDEFRPEIILCDIGLPGMDGYEVARRVRAHARASDAFLVALSGYALPDDLKRASDAGFDRHISKPANLDKLQEMFDNLPER